MILIYALVLNRLDAEHQVGGRTVEDGRCRRRIAASVEGQTRPALWDTLELGG